MLGVKDTMSSDEAIRLLLGAFETHSPEEIVQGFASGIDPNGTFHGRPWLTEFLDMYYRSPEFSRCVRCLIDAGVPCKSPLVMAVLLDDADQVRLIGRENPAAMEERVDWNCAFTPCVVQRSCTLRPSMDWFMQRGY